MTDRPGDQDRPSNRLAQEASPYLLQHARNPVDWYPWGPEALERARREDKPILLSVGYAACHWCHVMERESFEDEATARLMNANFVPVKVDREERPDIDSIYMDAVQAMTGSGGWPMTVFLTPDGRPFYAGTYFPKEDRHGLPAFTRVLEALAQAWREQRDRVAEQGARVTETIGRGAVLRQSVDPLNEDILRLAHAHLREVFDPRWGGFGGAPKFPQPMTLEFLLRCHLRGYDGALVMVTTTLDRMASGGMYDQVGGGFHRYSTDAMWLIPHFEKMLYDNAQLARLYARAWQVTGREGYRRVAEETLDYLLREMRHPEGGFFSSQDADSEGEEGKFFAWDFDDLAGAAGEAVAEYFGATPGGNWEGKNVLWTPRLLEEVAAGSGRSREDLSRAVEAARGPLFELREQRVHPATDDKILAAWNGLAIAALAEAGRALDRSDYVEAARAALGFVHSRLIDARGRLHRSWREGRIGPSGYLDDYACLAEGALTLYETTFDPTLFQKARGMVDEIVELFADPDGGGFFQTGSDAEALVVRPKELFDNATPSGSSMAAHVLLRMGLLTGDPEYERAGVSALRLVRDLLAQGPAGFGQALCALDLYLGPAREVAIVGDLSAGETLRLVAEVHRRFLPNTVLAAGRPDDPKAAAAVPLLEGRTAANGKAAAYVCERFVCRRPVTEPEALAAQLVDAG